MYYVNYFVLLLEVGGYPAVQAPDDVYVRASFTVHDTVTLAIQGTLNDRVCVIYVSTIEGHVRFTVNSWLM